MFVLCYIYIYIRKYLSVFMLIITGNLKPDMLYNFYIYVLSKSFLWLVVVFVMTLKKWHLKIYGHYGDNWLSYASADILSSLNFFFRFVYCWCISTFPAEVHSAILHGRCPWGTVKCCPKYTHSVVRTDVTISKCNVDLDSDSLTLYFIAHLLIWRSVLFIFVPAPSW